MAKLPTLDIKKSVSAGVLQGTQTSKVDKIMGLA